MGFRYRICPKCGSKEAAKIVYGEPDVKLLEQVERKKVVLGGCSIPIPTPEYYCWECEHEWLKEESIDRAYREIVCVIACVGGYFGTSYRVEWHMKTGEVTHKLWENSMEENASIHTTTFNDASYLDSLKNTNLLSWKKDYQPNEMILDGTSWTVEIQTVNKVIEKYGSNAYPKEWEVFCELMERVSGKKFR